MRDDEGGGGTPSTYKSFDGPEVKVEVDDLFGYYQAMVDLQMDAMGPANSEITVMTTMIQRGLTMPGGDAGAFPEGVLMAQLLTHRQSDFQHFVGDVMEGLRNIGSAAAVIAEIYDGTDNESGASFNDIGFVFSDAGAVPPRGFRKVESWAEFDQAQREQGGGLTMAASGAEPTSSQQVAAGVTIYWYADGSSKQVVVSAATGSSWESGQTTTTTIYGPGAVPVQTIIERSSTVTGGYKMQTMTVVNGDDKNHTTSTSTTTTHPDGRITVSSESSTTSTGEDGKTVTSKPTVTEPVTVTPGQHNEIPDVGPVEQAENQLETHGSDYFVEQMGRGY